MYTRELAYVHVHAYVIIHFPQVFCTFDMKDRKRKRGNNGTGRELCNPQSLNRTQRGALVRYKLQKRGSLKQIYRFEGLKWQLDGARCNALWQNPQISIGARRGCNCEKYNNKKVCVFFLIKSLRGMVSAYALLSLRMHPGVSCSQESYLVHYCN